MPWEGLGAVLQGAGALYQGYSGLKGAEMMAEQQAAANALAQKQFGLAEDAYRRTLADKAASQNALEQGLAYSPYTSMQNRQQTVVPGATQLTTL